MLCLLGFAGVSKAQTTNNENNNWILKQTTNEVKIYMRLENCNNATTVALKFENTGTNGVLVTWISPANADGNKMSNLVMVDANAAVNGACGSTGYQNMLFPAVGGIMPELEFTVKPMLGASK